MASRIRLSGAVEDLASLGFAGVDALLDGRAELGDRVELVASFDGGEVLRVPLPGTPDAAGRVRERPRGAGTGWLRVTRYTGGRAAWLPLVRARFGTPPSESLGERDWNLACHLLEHGVGTPEPLAVAARGAGPVAAASCFVAREPEGAVPLVSMASALDERALAALTGFVERVREARADLAAVEPDELLLVRDAEDDCGAHQIADLVSERRGEPKRRRLPGVLLASPSRVVLRSRADARIEAALAKLLDLLAEESGNPDVRVALGTAVAG